MPDETVEKQIVRYFFELFCVFSGLFIVKRFTEEGHKE